MLDEQNRGSAENVAKDGMDMSIQLKKHIRWSSGMPQVQPSLLLLLCVSQLDHTLVTKG